MLQHRADGQLELPGRDRGADGRSSSQRRPHTDARDHTQPHSLSRSEASLTVPSPQIRDSLRWISEGGGAGGARTHDRRIMRSPARRSGCANCTDTTEPSADGPDCTVCTDDSVHEPVHALPWRPPAASYGTLLPPGRPAPGGIRPPEESPTLLTAKPLERGHPAPTGTFVRRRTGCGSPPDSSAVPQAADPRLGSCRSELGTPAALGDHARRPPRTTSA